MSCGPFISRTTSEFSYGMAANMSLTLSSYGSAGVAPSAMRRLVMAPDRWTSTGMPSLSSFQTAASAWRLAPLVSSVKARLVSIGTVVSPITVLL